MTYSSSVVDQYTALLTLLDCSMPPIEADTAYQGCLPTCELHSRSSLSGIQVHAILRLRTRGLCNLQIAHMCYVISRSPVQSWDSENAQCNLKIARLRGTYIKGV